MLFNRKYIQKLEEDIAQLTQSIQVLELRNNELESELASRSEAVSVNDQEKTLEGRLLQAEQPLLNQIYDDVNKISERLFEPMSASEGTNENIENNRDEIGKLSSSMGNIASRTHASLDDVQALREMSGEIKGFTDTIQSISEQTNLLALNAAIEAARAGEHGRGFAVVADEVRTLANKARDSSEQISALVQRIDERTAKVSTQIETLHSVTIEVNESCSRLESSFKETAKSSDELMGAGYYCMAFAHGAGSLLELFQWKQTRILAVINGHAELGADLRNTQFGEWYYHGTDNEFKFRELTSFVSIHEQLDQMMSLSKELVSNAALGQTEIEALDAQMNTCLFAIYQALVDARKYLFDHL